MAWRGCAQLVSPPTQWQHVPGTFTKPPDMISEFCSSIGLPPTQQTLSPRPCMQREPLGPYAAPPERSAPEQGAHIPENPEQGPYIEPKSG